MNYFLGILAVLPLLVFGGNLRLSIRDRNTIRGEYYPFEQTDWSLRFSAELNGQFLDSFVSLAHRSMDFEEVITELSIPRRDLRNLNSIQEQVIDAASMTAKDIQTVELPVDEECLVFLAYSELADSLLSKPWDQRYSPVKAGLLLHRAVFGVAMRMIKEGSLEPELLCTVNPNYQRKRDTMLCLEDDSLTEECLLIAPNTTQMSPTPFEMEEEEEEENVTSSDEVSSKMPSATPTTDLPTRPSKRPPPRPLTRPTKTPRPLTRPTKTPRPPTRPTKTPRPPTRPTKTPRPPTRPTKTPKDPKKSEENQKSQIG